MIPGIRKIHAHAPSAGIQCCEIVEMLRADHALLNALFDRFARAAEFTGLSAARERLARRICDTLLRQRLAEEEVLYPEIRARDDKLVFALLLANEAISMRIAEIRDPALPRSGHDLAVFRLIATVRRNMGEREQVLFPFLRRQLSATRMQWLGTGFAQRKLLHVVGNAAGMQDALVPMLAQG